MKIVYVTAMLVALALTPQLSAQQTGAQRGGPPPNRKMMMERMDSLDRRLDSLVTRMNQTTGEQKITAMSAVINEMVSQRHAMRRHMRRMMNSGTMKHHGDTTGAHGDHP